MTDKELRILDEMLANLEIWSTWNKTFANEMIGICSKMRNLLADRKTENSSEKPNNSTISKMEQVDEPKTQTKTQNSNLTFEKADERKCIDCNFLTYMFGKTWCNIKCENPHDKVCDRFKPKDEPQERSE